MESNEDTQLFKMVDTIQSSQAYTYILFYINVIVKNRNLLIQTSHLEVPNIAGWPGRSINVRRGQLKLKNHRGVPY